MNTLCQTDTVFTSFIKIAELLWEHAVSSIIMLCDFRLTHPEMSNKKNLTGLPLCTLARQFLSDYIKQFMQTKLDISSQKYGSNLDPNQPNLITKRHL